MRNLLSLFITMRIAGLLAIGALFLFVEWRFIHGNLSNALNLLVQLFVVGSVFLLPLFWVLLAVTLVGHFGKRRIEKRVEEPVTEE
ncbi:MAG: hypothetical protein HQ583_10590 [Candidatus Abyssubacteria bacterium]|nr:hypothetical protein [Candidatus Abyssubacteria bacterium]